MVPISARGTLSGKYATKFKWGTPLKWIQDPSLPVYVDMVLPDTPPRLSSQSTPDYFLLSEETALDFQVISCKTLPGVSDHFAVELKLSSTSQLQKGVMTTTRSFAHTDWDKFKSNIVPRLKLKKIATNRNLPDREIVGNNNTEFKALLSRINWVTNFRN